MQFEFPVGPHRFTTDEFNRKRAAYAAKYGYTMHIPGFSDIFKLGFDYKPTEIEVELYRKKDVIALGWDKYHKIRRLMEKKKESFLRMMSSPTPTWINNIGTTMTFLDDINDAAGTLAVVARTMAHVLPKVAARYLMGPAGWALTAADVVGLAMTIARAPINAIASKRRLNDSLLESPFSKEAKVKRAARLRRIKPTKGEIIEALQVTNNVFGVGLSLGPILGAFIEAFTGPYRVLQGKKVTVKWPVPKLERHELTAISGLLAVNSLNYSADELSWEDHTKCYLIAEMATHVLYPLFLKYHPLDHIDGLENVILQPRAPTDPLTKLLFDEEGVDPNTHLGIVGAEDTQGSAGELMDLSIDRGAGSFKEYTRKQKHTMLGQLGMQAVNNFSTNALALWEGEDQVVIDHPSFLKACFMIIEHGFMMVKSTWPSQYEAFATVVGDLNDAGRPPDWDMIKNVICPRLGIWLHPRPIMWEVWPKTAWVPGLYTREPGLSA